MRVKTEARRNAIIAVAWEVFRADGYERTTMSAIAARLGGSKGTLYGYFSSKEELLLATVDHVLAARGEAAFEKLASAGSLAARLTDFAHDYIALRAHRDTIALDRIVIAEAGRSNIGRAMQERLLLPQWHRFAEHLCKEAEQGRLHFEDADEAASVFRALLTLPLLAPSLSAVWTCAGVADGFEPRYSAATPATCGVAIDVPLIVLVAVSLVFQAEVMSRPGAKMSVHVPKFENDERASLLSTEFTVIASGVRAGVKLHASALELPEAIA